MPGRFAGGEHPISRRNMLRGGAAFGGLLLGGAALDACSSSAAPSASSSGSTAKSGQLDKVTAQFGSTFTLGQTYAIEMLGKYKGYFEKNGIDISFIEGTGSANAMQVIGAGKADVGFFIEVLAMIQANSKGAAATAVAITCPADALAVISRGADPIKSPKDLVGKTLGIQSGTIEVAAWPDYAAQNGIDPNSVHIKDVAGSSQIPALAAKQIDAYIADSWTAAIPLSLGLNPAQIPYVSLRPGYGIVAGNALIKKNPDLVRRIVLSVYQAYTAAIANPSEAYTAGHSLYPMDFKSETTVVNEVKNMTGLFKTYPPPAGKSLFYTPASLWENYVKLAVKYLKLSPAPQASDLYTNQFVPAA
jgi:NitT/TauT family transport system substrate-binding protein